VKIMARRCKENGIALLMVIVVIAALIIIAVPFLASMRMAEKSSKSFLDKKRAEWIARGALNHGISSLYATHDDNERYYLLNSGQGDPMQSANSTPDFDDFDELMVLPLALSMPGGDNVDFNNTKGEMWSVEAADEQGKINVNSATPWLIANLMGVTELTASIDYKESVIPVADPTIFFSDGNSDSIDGYVRINGEYIAYRGVSEGALTGCLRGIFLEAEDHPRCSLVYDGRAFKISEHRSTGANRRLRLFSTPESIRDISNWTKFDAVAEALLYRKLYLDKLKDLGVDEKDIELAKIDPGRMIEPEKPDYSPDQKEVNDKLAGLGQDADKLRELLGDEIVDMVGRRIPAQAPDNPRRQQWFEQITQGFKEYVEQIEAKEEEKEERLKKFLPEAFRNISVLRELVFLEALSAIDFHRLKDFITTYSWRARDWSRATGIRADVPQVSRGYVNRRSLSISDTRHFNRGTLIKIFGSGNVEYAVIAGRDAMGRIITDRDIINSYAAGEAYVQAVLRHPVNINSCSDRTLKSLLVGVRFHPFESDIRYIMRGRQPSEREVDWITIKEAETLVDLIRESPPSSHEDLAGILDTAVGMGAISQSDRVAVLTNAINPNDPTLVVSTAGFCYKSYNIFSIKATGVINSPAGIELAKHTIHQVVEIAPPMTVTWVLDSQQDFSPGIVRWYDPNSGRLNILQFDDREARHIATTPRNLTGNWQFPSTSHEPQEGDMMIQTGRHWQASSRGNQQQSGKYSNHFDTTLEGQDLGSGMQLRTNGQFPVIPERANQNPQSVGTGYIGFWFKPGWSGGTHFFLDHAKDEYESRVTFYYDGGELVLMVCDAGLDQVGNTLRAQYAFEADTWYHVACSWKGVRYGDLAMFVDGKALGQYENFTRLLGDIDEKAYQITVENAADLPLGIIDAARGWFPVIHIDSEAMNVIDINGNTLTVHSQLEAPPQNPPPGWTPQLIRAAVRGTTTMYHMDGAIVTIWGYSNRLSEDLRIGGATTVYDLPSPTPETTVNKPRPPGPAQPGQFDGVTATETEIPVVSTANFPPEGFILINDEKIYYAGLAPDKFTGCLRGMENTTAADHDNGSSVKLISLKVTNTTDYKDSGYIQLDDEWVKYEKAQDANYQQQYFIMPYAGSGGGGGLRPGPGGGLNPGPVPFPPGGGNRPRPGDGNRPRPGGGNDGPVLPGPRRPRRPSIVMGPSLNFKGGFIPGIEIFPQAVPPALPGVTLSDSCRGQLGTTVNMHGSNAKVIPVFNVASSRAGGGDMVTAIDANHKEQGQVNHASGNMMALTDFVSSQYNQNEWGRLLKWPSGELPTEIQQVTMLGGSSLYPSAGVDATVDEISISADSVHSPYATHGFVVHQSVGASETAIVFGARQSHGGNDPPGGQLGAGSMGGVPRLAEKGGLIKVDDEIIGVSSVSGDSFTGLIRGVLGTQPAPHAEGARIYLVPFPRAGTIDGGLGDYILCRDPDETPNQGYIQVARTDGKGEILPYRRKSRSGFERYRDIYGQPVFRKAFGSPQTGCASGDLGIFIPFRYHDLYEPNTDSRQGVYYYVVNSFKHSYFRAINWDATVPTGTITKVQVRVDGSPGWEITPNNLKGGIFEFTNPIGENKIEVMGQRVEIRVYMTYEQDAYLYNAWKETPVIRSITLNYDQPNTVYHHETPRE